MSRRRPKPEGLAVMLDERTRVLLYEAVNPLTMDGGCHSPHSEALLNLLNDGVGFQRTTQPREDALNYITICTCDTPCPMHDPPPEVVTTTTADAEPRVDSQMRAMIDQACEDLGRHGLQPTDEAAQVVLNLIASASELGRLVRLRNEPSAVEALKAALRPFAEHGDMLEGCDPTDQWCEAEKDGRTHWLAVEHFHTASRALAHTTEEA